MKFVSLSIIALSTFIFNYILKTFAVIEGMCYEN